MLPSFLLITRAISAIVSVAISVVLLTYEYTKCYIADVIAVRQIVREKYNMEADLR